MKSIAAAAVMLMASSGAFASAGLAQKSGCLACHTTDKRIVGPAFRDVAKKYQGVKDAEAKVIDSITNGGSGKWGPIPMAPKGNNANLSAADIQALAKWILGGAN